MISDEKTAKKALELLVESGEILAKSVQIVGADLGKDSPEYVLYGEGVGCVMGEMCDELLEKLYEKHPHLNPLKTMEE